MTDIRLSDEDIKRIAEAMWDVDISWRPNDRTAASALNDILTASRKEESPGLYTTTISADSLAVDAINSADLDDIKTGGAKAVPTLEEYIRSRGDQTLLVSSEVPENTPKKSPGRKIKFNE